MSSTIVELAERQLAAYNASDLEAFVACYHEDVVVQDGDEVTVRGREAFRERYRSLFEHWDFGAEVPERLHLGPHCVDRERWWRTPKEGGERSEGHVLVRYEEREGSIGFVQFFR